MCATANVHTFDEYSVILKLCFHSSADRETFMKMMVYSGWIPNAVSSVAENCYSFGQSSSYRVGKAEA